MRNNLPDGYVEFEGCECPCCNGTGTEITACCPNGTVTYYNRCSVCHEQAIEDTCFLCEGVGEVPSFVREDYLRFSNEAKDL